MENGLGNGTEKKSVKSRIVSAAWQLFYEKGYNGTRLILLLFQHEG